jgi:hypothetical protein
MRSIRPPGCSRLGEFLCGGLVSEAANNRNRQMPKGKETRERIVT